MSTEKTFTTRETRVRFILENGHPPSRGARSVSPASRGVTRTPPRRHDGPPRYVRELRNSLCASSTAVGEDGTGSCGDGAAAVVDKKRTSRHASRGSSSSAAAATVAASTIASTPRARGEEKSQKKRRGKSKSYRSSRSHTSKTSASNDDNELDGGVKEKRTGRNETHSKNKKSRHRSGEDGVNSEHIPLEKTKEKVPPGIAPTFSEFSSSPTVVSSIAFAAEEETPRSMPTGGARGGFSSSSLPCYSSGNNGADDVVMVRMCEDADALRNDDTVYLNGDVNSAVVKGKLKTARKASSSSSAVAAASLSSYSNYTNRMWVNGEEEDPRWRYAARTSSSTAAAAAAAAANGLHYREGAMNQPLHFSRSTVIVAPVPYGLVDDAGEASSSSVTGSRDDEDAYDDVDAWYDRRSHYVDKKRSSNVSGGCGTSSCSTRRAHREYEEDADEVYEDGSRDYRNRRRIYVDPHASHGHQHSDFESGGDRRARLVLAPNVSIGSEEEDEDEYSVGGVYDPSHKALRPSSVRRSATILPSTRIPHLSTHGPSGPPLTDAATRSAIPTPNLAAAVTVPLLPIATSPSHAFLSVSEPTFLSNHAARAIASDAQPPHSAISHFCNRDAADNAVAAASTTAIVIVVGPGAMKQRRAQRKSVSPRSTRADELFFAMQVPRLSDERNKHAPCAWGIEDSGEAMGRTSDNVEAVLTSVTAAHDACLLRLYAPTAKLGETTIADVKHEVAFQLGIAVETLGVRCDGINLMDPLPLSLLQLHHSDASVGDCGSCSNGRVDPPILYVDCVTTGAEASAADECTQWLSSRKGDGSSGGARDNYHRRSRQRLLTSPQREQRTSRPAIVVEATEEKEKVATTRLLFSASPDVPADQVTGQSFEGSAEATSTHHKQQQQQRQPRYMVGDSDELLSPEAVAAHIDQLRALINSSTAQLTGDDGGGRGLSRSQQQQFSWISSSVLERASREENARMELCKSQQQNVSFLTFEQRAWTDALLGNAMTPYSATGGPKHAKRQAPLIPAKKQKKDSDCVAEAPDRGRSNSSGGSMRHDTDNCCASVAVRMITIGEDSEEEEKEERKWTMGTAMASS